MASARSMHTHATMHERPIRWWSRLRSLPLRPFRRLATCASLPQRVARLLDRQSWLLPDPAVQVTPVQLSTAGSGAGFHVIRDDLTHPLLGGNKFRKLDGLWCTVQQASEVVTCGGLQSAHTLAVAAACAERGKRAHLLVRGERPAVPTGHHLYARMLAARVQYVSRQEYADRAAMFERYVAELRAEQEGGAALSGSSGGTGSVNSSSSGSVNVDNSSAGASSSGGGSVHSSVDGSSSSSSSMDSVAVIPEGAACSAALLGLIRLVAWLAQQSPLAGTCGSASSNTSGGSSNRWHVVVDSGTGATATGLALGAALLGLPWRITGVCLAGPIDYYQQQQRELTAAFFAEHWAATAGEGVTGSAGPAAAVDEAALQESVSERLRWVPRLVPRRFGKVLPGEVAACRAVAQQHGLLLDPIWNLAAWEVACQLATAGAAAPPDPQRLAAAQAAEQRSTGDGELVVMLHTGGMLGLCGLAQRFPDEF